MFNSGLTTISSFLYFKQFGGLWPGRTSRYLITKVRCNFITAGFQLKSKVLDYTRIWYANLHFGMPHCLHMQQGKLHPYPFRVSVWSAQSFILLEYIGFPIVHFGKHQRLLLGRGQKLLDCSILAYCLGVPCMTRSLRLF